MQLATLATTELEPVFFFQGPGLVDSVLLGTLAKIMAACKTRL